MEEIIAELPGHLNATLTANNEEFEVLVIEADKLWSFVKNKKAGPFIST